MMEIVDTIQFDVIETTDEYITIRGYANKYTTEGKPVVDMEGTVFRPSGIDLSRYRKNPVILFEHDPKRAVGRAVKVEIRTDGLYIEAKVYKDIDEVVYTQVKTGVISTFSIGFWDEDGYWSDVLDAYVISLAQLVEVSLVSIPSNSDSVIEHVDMCEAGVCTTVRNIPDDKLKQLKAQHKRSVDKALIKKIVVKLLDK